MQLTAMQKTEGFIMQCFRFNDQVEVVKKLNVKCSAQWLLTGKTILYLIL